MALRSRLTSILVTAVVTAALGLPTVLQIPAAGATTATITYLPGLGGTEGTAVAINRSGVIAGYSTLPSGERRAVTWRNGVVKDLKIPSSVAVDINRYGQVVGTSEANGQRAFLWDHGVVTYFSQGSSASAINDLGMIAGAIDAPDGTYHAALWANGSVSDLGTLGGAYAYSQASDINNSGAVVGSSTVDNNWHAFSWSSEVMRDLNGNSQSSAAFATNDNGVIAGYAYFNNEEHAATWKNGQVRDLGTLGGTESAALGINGHGDVVGYSTLSTTNGTVYPFYSHQGAMIRLPTPADTSAVASDVNRRGNRVVGQINISPVTWQVQ